MEIYLGIYDKCQEYSRRLISWLIKKTENRYRTVEFTKTENIRAFAENHIMEIMMITFDDFSTDMVCENIGRIVILCEEKPSLKQKAWAEENGVTLVFKYQPVSVLIKEIMNGNNKYNSEIFSEKRLIAVYSPINRCGKSFFSYAISQILGESRPTLFISFDEYFSLCDLLEINEKGNLMDVMYYYIQGSIKEKERSIIKSKDHIDILMPSDSPEDLRSLRAEEICGILDYFINDSIYSNIVVDVGRLQDNVNLLGKFDHIYLPVIDDDFERKKINRFYDHMSKRGTGIIERIHEINPPVSRWGSENGNITIEQDYRMFVRTCIGYMDGE